MNGIWQPLATALGKKLFASSTLRRTGNGGICCMTPCKTRSASFIHDVGLHCQVISLPMGACRLTLPHSSVLKGPYVMT